MAKEVVLTGLRSNAEFHIGNYLGAILPMVQLQKKYAGKYQLNMFLPDLHSIITPIEHGSLFKQTLKNLGVFVAAGLNIDDPDTYIYRQSYIPAHAELTWILGSFTGHGEMGRMAEFKDKAAAIGEDRVSVGLFSYPILMAADILLYGAKYIPVGDDQRQHIEFTRDIAMRMNNKFGDLFVVPADNKAQAEFAGRGEPVRVRSLRYPMKKMSKSVNDPAGTIMLSDSPSDAAKKIMSATTDNETTVGRPDFKTRPGVANLVLILNLLSPDITDTSGMTYKELKELVAKSVSDFLANLQASTNAIDDSKVVNKLAEDEIKMSEVANRTLLKVQRAVGLRPHS